MRYIALLILFFASGATFGTDGSLAVDNSDVIYLNRLIVEVDPAAITDSVDTLAQSLTTSKTSTLAASFAYASSASLLIPLRLSSQDLASLKGDDPAVILNNSIVLTYPDDATTRAAVMTILRSGLAKNVYRDSAGSYSTDPLVPIVSGQPTQYQWGLYTINAIQSGNTTGIWAKTRGSAYVALLDNGLMTAGGVHPDLVGSYRKQFSTNFGYTTNGANGASTTANDLDEHPFQIPPMSTYYAGHGTHTFGLVAARNDNGIGGAGVCPYCSVASGRISTWTSPGYDPSASYVAAGLTGMADRGIQVITQSFGFPGDTCSSQPTICSALTYADTRDVVVVAASGNAQTILDFPAAQSPQVIAAGGVSTTGAIWTESTGEGSNYSTSTKAQQFVAPAKSVLSTVYTGYDWNPDSPWQCGDNFPASFAPGYGDCTGTSMAAPQLAGTIALMRSVAPLMTKAVVRDILGGTSNTTLCTSTRCGNGIPDATAAVNAALGGSNVKNRTTPLFALYSSAALDHFYTVVPQMAMAALKAGSLLPNYATGGVGYSSIGTSVSGYSSFPYAYCNTSGCVTTPKATAMVFTTHVNPLGGVDLLPIYRLSYKCGDELLTTPPNPSNPACSSNPSHLSHLYVTSASDFEIYTGKLLNGTDSPTYPGAGYAYDGIEGFVFPSTIAQPTGTVALCSKYDPTRDDYAFILGAGTGGTDCSATTDGYTGGNYSNQLTVLGWVYPATYTYGPTPANTLPSVSMSAPADGTGYPTGTAVTITAAATDSDGSIAKVRFYADQLLIGSVSSSPYTLTWTPPGAGTYALSAIAVDNRGAVKHSGTRTISVGAPPVVNNYQFTNPTSIGPTDYVINPTGTGVYWAFTAYNGAGQSGISGNNSAFTFKNPARSGGGNVALIQGAVPFSQSVTFPYSGTFVVCMYSAQRWGNVTYQTVNVKIGTTTVWAGLQPANLTMTQLCSPPFPVTAGTKTLSIVGLNPNAGDNTIFIDDVTLNPS